MQHEILNNQSAAQSKDISIMLIVSSLRGLNESRIRAYNYYPHAVKTDKWDAVCIIRDELNRIPNLMTYRLQAIALLGLNNHFLRIQPYTTKKLNETYLRNLTAQMQVCRNYLGRLTQNLRLG